VSMIDERYSIKNVVNEIECEVAYLEDAPDEELAPYMEDLGMIGERLLRLMECLFESSVK
jgi:hypothetical protein